MYEDTCTVSSCRSLWCNHMENTGYSDEEQRRLMSLVDTEDPAFQNIARLLADIRSAGVKFTRESVGAAVRLGRHYHRTATAPAPERSMPDLRQPVVYYVRFGNLVKIGTTINLQQRMADLRPDEMLALEQGSYELEKQRHKQFAAYHHENELFYPGPRLQRHIERLRGRERVKATRHIPRQRRVVDSGADALF